MVSSGTKVSIVPSQGYNTKITSNKIHAQNENQPACGTAEALALSYAELIMQFLQMFLLQLLQYQIQVPTLLVLTPPIQPVLWIRL